MTYIYFCPIKAILVDHTVDRGYEILCFFSIEVKLSERVILVSHICNAY